MTAHWTRRVASLGRYKLPSDDPEYHLKRNVREGRYPTTSLAAWSELSAEGRQVIQQLLCVAPTQRLSSWEALQHPVRSPPRRRQCHRPHPRHAVTTAVTLAVATPSPPPPPSPSPSPRRHAVASATAVTLAATSRLTPPRLS